MVLKQSTGCREQLWPTNQLGFGLAAHFSYARVVGVDAYWYQIRIRSYKHKSQADGVRLLKKCLLSSVDLLVERVEQYLPLVTLSIVLAIRTTPSTTYEET